MFPVTGDTYELREQLKAMRCTWDADHRCWLAPDAGVQASAQALADAEPLRKWREYAGTLPWVQGSFSTTVWEAGLRACSLGVPLAVAMQEIGERVTANGGHIPSGWLERNVGRAYEMGEPPDWLTGKIHVPTEKPTWEPSAPREKPKFEETALQKFSGAWKDIVDTAWLADRSPVDPTSCTSDGFMRQLYLPGERVAIFDVFESQAQWLWSHEHGFEPSRIDYQAWDVNDPKHESGPPVKGGPEFPHTGPRGIWYLCNPISGEWGLKGKEDKHGRPTWTRRSEPQVTAWRYFALESDDADPKEWVAAWVQLPLPIAAIYTSGGSSVHFLVRVDAETKAQFDQWRELAKRTLIPLGADKGCMSAVRLTRVPGTMREGKDDKATGKYVKFPKPKPQKLLFLDPSPSDAPLIERAAVRDSLGPWARWVESTVAGEREEMADDELATLRKGLAGFAGKRASELRDRLRRWEGR